MAFWLRRRLVIEDIQVMPNPIQGVPDDYISPRQEEFLSAGNEIAAFLLGFHYCLRYEYKSGEIDLLTGHLSTDFMTTVGVLLREKNVSPHALFLIYKALFIDLNKKN